ncbi:alpha/beta fold hydrolase [Actinomadura algeriensis]|uniref:Pimeloyl-ACP methyl ester carboxylesterase n=1 Tax=Actinomadura algeriensis TaxID=1679523 RepID=A0ABR9JUN3_9ACTN|nr:alpha/beta fold hydrolase [Actinomadura algeriensis]MBE1534287.1 pimeloyl-ACP methyl ester carboxylesterase [Actinomadura algeriensis]
MTRPRAPLPVRRLGYAAFGTVAPAAAGRRATDAFSTTRALGLRPDDVVPLGARRFEVGGDPDVRGGYLWGGPAREDGPVALLVHGWGIDSSSMQALVPPLRALGYRVATFDAPGHGVASGSQATMTQFTRATGAVLDALGDAFGEVRAVVAHSLGSIAAAGALAARPGASVRCLALIAPTCTLTGVLERWARAELRLRRPVVAEIYRELRRRNGVPVSHWDVAGLGGDLDLPVLVLHDPRDDVVPYAEAEAVAAGLRGARLEDAPGGHFGILLDPGVRDRVAAFVTRHASTGEEVIR